MSRTANRSGSSDGRTAGSPARSSTRGSKRSDPAPSPAREVLRVIGSLLGIILGLVLAAVCIGVWYACTEAAGIMHEIASRDVSGPREQVDQYEEFFAGLDTEQFIVRRDEPRNLQNVITYLWTVEHRQSGEVVPFRWEWDMSTLDVEPRSNGALLLDRRLKHKAGSELEGYDFYDEEDAFAMAIVTQDISVIGMDDMGGGWEGPEYTEGVPPPLISPDDAKSRAAAHAAQEKEKLEQEMQGEADAGDAAGDDTEKENVPEVRLPENHPANPPVRDDM